jgi:hypothetical protein
MSNNDDIKQGIKCIKANYFFPFLPNENKTEIAVCFFPVILKKSK